MQYARETEDLDIACQRNAPRWMPGRRLTCPHLVIRGAVGGERQIGHVVCPSSWLNDTAPAAADASADERGMMTCNMSCHWKKLRAHMRSLY
jgi:hypothetical protein